MLITGVCHNHLLADQVQNLDLVEFFKKAICNPPDVSHFSATQHMLRAPSLPPGAPELSISSGQQWDRVSVFEGARLGADFYTRFIRETNASGDTFEVDHVTGRAGSTSFQVNVNTLTTTAEQPGSSLGNPAASATKSQYNLLCQFLNMGLAGVEPSSITWVGLEFTATLSSGHPVIGKLAISNNLPFRLELSSQANGPSWKAFEYTYPSPPGRLGGFPQTTVVFGRSSHGLTPALAIRLLHVEMANEQGATPPISVSDFVTTNQVFTNVYSNGALYAVLPGGKVLRSPGRTAGPTPHRGESVLGRRIVVIALLGLTTGSVLLVWLRGRGASSSRKQERYL